MTLSTPANLLKTWIRCREGKKCSRMIWIWQIKFDRINCFERTVLKLESDAEWKGLHKLIWFGQIKFWWDYLTTLARLVGSFTSWIVCTPYDFSLFDSSSSIHNVVGSPETNILSSSKLNRWPQNCWVIPETWSVNSSTKNLKCHLLLVLCFCFWYLWFIFIHEQSCCFICNYGYLTLSVKTKLAATNSQDNSSNILNALNSSKWIH